MVIDPAVFKQFVNLVPFLLVQQMRHAWSLILREMLSLSQVIPELQLSELWVSQ